VQLTMKSGDRLLVATVQVIALQKEASDVLSLVQGLKNIFSPVSRLPREILEKILTMRTLEGDLLTASCVCRHWRDTLTSSPRLWTKFQCANVAQTLQYLARSEPVPINVVGDFNSDIETLVVLGSATNRFASLALRLRPFDLLEVFHLFSTPAPALERLEISTTPYRGDGPAFRPTIPATFLGGSAPALKSLCLNGINTTLNFSEFPALTDLTLTTNLQVFDMSEMFRVLATAKLLEGVSIKFSGPTTSIPRSQHAVRLPHLKRLSFSNTVGEFPKRLLSLLAMPSVEEVKLDICLIGEDTRTIRDFLPARIQNFPHLLKAENMKLDVPHSRCNIQLGGPTGVVSVRALRSGSREQNDGFQSHWLSSLGLTLIADVKDLILRNYHPDAHSLDQCPVLKTLETLGGLRSLTVERCNNTVLVEALSPAKKGRILFPRLESLAFRLTTEPTTIFPGLTYMARARIRAGFPLSKVSSDQYTTFRRPDTDALQRYVDCVELNTRADSYSRKSMVIPFQSIAAVSIYFQGVFFEPFVVLA